PDIYTLSLHDALPILLFKGIKIILSIWLTIMIYTFKITFVIVSKFSNGLADSLSGSMNRWIENVSDTLDSEYHRNKAKETADWKDRKSTRLNSSHVSI